MPDVTDPWDDLKDEHQRERLGSLWLDEVTRAVRAVAPRYPAPVYARAPTWDEAGLEDLAQDVVVGQLLATGQIEYIVHAADGLDRARSLLRQQVRWTVARRRTRTVLDNLLDRCRAALRAGLLEEVPGRPGWWGSTGEPREARDEELAEAVRRVARLPRTPVRGGERAPVLYPTDVLAEAVREVHRTLPGGVNERDLDTIFGRVLTDHLPGALVLEDVEFVEADRSLGPEEEVVMNALVEQVFEGLDQEERVLLGMKMLDEPDERVARTLGISRPTAAKRHRAVAARVRLQLLDTPPRLQDPVVMALGARLVADLPAADDEEPR